MKTYIYSDWKIIVKIIMYIETMLLKEESSEMTTKAIFMTQVDVGTINLGSL